MTRLVGLPLAAGLLSALLFLSAVKDVPAGFLLSYLAPLPLLMLGLGFGQGAALGAGLAGAAAVILGTESFVAIPFLIATTVPAFLVSNRALMWRTLPDGSTEWYPPGLVLAWLTAAALGLILLGSALLAGNPDGVQGAAAATIGRMLEAAQELSPEDRDKIASLAASVLPAMVAGSWLLMAVVNATLAQGLLVRMGRNRRPSPVYRDLWFPGWLGLVMVATGAVGVLAGGDVGYVAGNMAAVSLVPFAFLGVATVHRWAKGRAEARFILAVTYGMLILVLPWAAMAAAGLGLVRFLTMRFRRGESGGGEEG